MLLYFQILGLRIPSYATVAVIGGLLSLCMALHAGRKYCIRQTDILCASGYGLLGMLIGAKLFYVIPFIPELISDVFHHGVSHVKIQEIFAGYVFYGGLLGIMCGIYCYTRWMKMPFLLFGDILALIIPLFHGIGRIGCFLAGCCYGIEYHGMFAVRFPENPYEPGIELVERFPVQLLESGCNFALFIFLYQYYRKGNHGTGVILGLYLMIYPAIRFLTEVLRGDEVRGVWQIGSLEVSFSQIISLILLPAGIYLYYNAKKNNSKS